MPVDAVPTADGNMLADFGAGVGVVVPASELGWMKEATPDEPFYRSHYASCLALGDRRGP